MSIQIPPAKHRDVVKTDQMLEIINRTLAVTAVGGLCVWCGRARLGKTTTALYLRDELDKALAAGTPNAFRAGYYSTGPISSKVSNPDRSGVVGLYEGVLGLTMDRGVTLKSTEYLAAMAVDSFISKNIRIVEVDEAGYLSPEAIRGMVKVWDRAQLLGWPFTIVFVGMNELPKSVKKHPQVRERVAEWCFFKEYSFDETWKLLREFHPHFKGLDPLDVKHREQVEFIYKTYGGVPGLILQFILKFERRLKGLNAEVDMRFLRAIHVATKKEEEAILESAKRDYESKPIQEAA